MAKVKMLDGDRMRLAHAKCVEAYNSCIACGTDAPDCASPYCAMSSHWVRPSTSAERRTAFDALATK